MIEGKAEGAFYTPLVWSIGSALLVSGLALAILMISAVLGAFRFFDPVGSESAAFGLWLRGDVGDVASPQSMKRLVAWRGVAPTDVAFRESRTLEGLTQEKVGVLAVPDARSLSRKEAVALRRFLREGGGVVLTGSVGVMDDEGGWRGYDLMQTLLGVEAVLPLGRDASQGVFAARRGPLSAELAPEEPLELIAEPGVPAIANPESEIQWSLAAGDENAERPLARDASKRVEVGRGRLVWLAMGPESAVQYGAERWRAMVRLMRSAAAWAGRRSQIEVLPWPEGAPFAAVIGRPDSPPAEEDADVLAARRIRRAASSGGLAMLPAARPSSPDPAGASSPVRDAIARHPVLGRTAAWVAKPGELLQWQRAREQVSARAERVGLERLLIAVSNQGSETTSGVALRIHLGYRASEIEVRGTNVGQSLPAMRFARGSSYVDLMLGDLDRLESRAFTVDFTPLPLDGNPQLQGRSELQISARPPISHR